MDQVVALYPQETSDTYTLFTLNNMKLFNRKWLLPIFQAVCLSLGGLSERRSWEAYLGRFQRGIQLCCALGLHV